MKLSFDAIALVVAVITFGNAISIPQDTHSGFVQSGVKALGLPTSGLRTNCISVGFLPSAGDAHSRKYSMAEINTQLGAKASTYGLYAQIKDGEPFDGRQLLQEKGDVITSGAVFVASIMPLINFNKVTLDVAHQIANVIKKFTDEGIVVWLRFAHEMNYYASHGPYHGTSEDFLTAWKNVYDTNCKNNPKVNCFWSPNCEKSEELQPWWPGPEVVDIVGIDCYPKKDTTDNALFDQLYGGFYDTFSKPYGLPFAIGETGAGPGQKAAWLKQLVSVDHNKYPNYVSMSWFEYDKEVDFQIVMADDKEVLKKTKDILLTGSTGDCHGGFASNYG